HGHDARKISPHHQRPPGLIRSRRDPTQRDILSGNQYMEYLMRLARPLALTAILFFVPALQASAADADLKDPALRKRWEKSLKDFNIPGAVVVAVRGDQV